MKRIHPVLLVLVFLASLCIALSAGRYPIGLEGVARILFSGLGLDWVLGAPDRKDLLIFLNIRAPRIIMSLAVGCGISIAGAVFQALFRNPLAAPDILGVTAGSSFGAAVAILFLTNMTFAVQGCAFIFGITAVCLAYFLALSSWDRSASVLVISGIVVSAFFQAGLSILMYIANPYDQLDQIVFWIMGSFHTASWSKAAATLPLIVTGSVLLGVFSWRLNVMTQHEEDTMSLGVNVLAWRIFYVGISTLIVAASVATVGTIAWVGLIMPHIARHLTGADHKRLIPVTAFLGGTFLMLMDTLARTVLASEIPISIVTSIIGAPFLGYLVMNRKYAGAGNGFDH